MPLFERLLPRHMQIIYAINAKVLLEARKTKNFSDTEIRLISLIEERQPPVRIQSRLRRLAFDQRRLGAAHRPDEGHRLRRPAQALS